MMCDEKDYNLTVEILVDKPHSSKLAKGQICKAATSPKHPDDFFIIDSRAPQGDYCIDVIQAKVIKNG